MAQLFKALKVSLISSLLIMGLVAKPVQADHNDNLLIPLAGFVLLGSLLKHNHGHGHGHGYSNHHYGNQYGYSKRRYGHYGGYAHNEHGGHQHHRRARSHSYEGYKRRPERNKHR